MPGPDHDEFEHTRNVEYEHAMPLCDMEIRDGEAFGTLVSNQCYNPAHVKAAGDLWADFEKLAKGLCGHTR